MTKTGIGIVGAILTTGIAATMWQQARLGKLAAERAIKSGQAEAEKLRAEVRRLSQIEVDRAQLDRLKDSDAELRAELARLRNRLSTAAAPERVTRAASEVPSAASSDSGDGRSGSNRVAQAFNQFLKGATEEQILSQLPRMKERLALQPQQEQAIRDVVHAAVERGNELGRKLFAGTLTRAEAIELQSITPNAEAEVKALFTPDQLAAYQQHQLEEAAPNARLMANSDLLQMQSRLGLNLEQQDQAFQALYGYTLDLLTGKFTEAAPRDGDLAASLRWHVDQKVMAMEPVLSPEQFQKYRQWQGQQADFIAAFIPKPASSP